jgi:hypothetical protein
MPFSVNMMQAVEYVSPGNAGMEELWDFSHAIPNKEVTFVKETISQTDGYNVSITNLQGTNFFYSSNANESIFNGFQSESVNLAFDKPIKKVNYPFTYGNKLVGYFSGHTHFNNSTIEYSRNGSYSTEADAVGTMVMPSGQVLKNVLRLKMIEKYVEQACSAAEVEIIKYAWYIEEYRYPVFVIHDITTTHADGRVSSQRNSYVTTATLYQAADTPVYESEEPMTVEGKQVDIEHAVYPNPYSDFLHITYNSNYNELTGTYYLRLQFGDKVYVRALVKN